MKLTQTERWTLVNQYRILEALYPKEADFFKEAQEILEHGFEIEYSGLCQNVYKDEDTLSTDECKEVIDILSMFDNLRYSYDQIEDKSDIEKHSLSFSGFDGNDSLEVKYLSYSRFLCEVQGKFEKLTKGDFYNSHAPSLDMYRRMLGAYKNIERKSQMSKEEINKVLSEKIHPSRR